MNVIEMPVGRQLDALFAERVLGWKAWKEEREGYFAVLWQKPGEGEPWTRYSGHSKSAKDYSPMPVEEIDNSTIIFGLPAFSASMGELWPVVMERKKEKFLSLQHSVEWGWFAEYGLETVGGSRMNPTEVLIKAMLLDAQKVKRREQSE